MVMPTLRRRRLEDLQRRGLAPTTQPCDVAAVPPVAHHYRRAADQLSEEERRQDCLVLRKEKTVAARTCRIHLDGSRLFDELTRQRPWPVCDRVRPRHRQTRPVVWSPQAVRALLAVVERPHARMCLTMSSAGGLRRRAGTPRQVSAIDPQRLLVQVRPGKGGQERLVRWPERTLER
jgi:hypothetical protein